jgi:mannonate dehydratase
MPLEQTWRWFGPKDPISLKEIRQTGATGVVTALHHIPAGEVWSMEEILTRKKMIEAERLRWSVVESVPVHEEIKKRRGRFALYTDRYADTVRNLGRCGIDIVCYNFMPVLDWSRTDLEVVFRDGSITSKFEARQFAAFDLFLLQRSGARHDYTEGQYTRAREWFDTLDATRRQQLARNILLGFPGSGEAYTLDGLREALHGYDGIGDAEFRGHLEEFLRRIVPIAEEAGVLLAIHPDDPPWPLLGLPRVVSTSSDVERILNVVDSPANGLTLCTGSFGASSRNDLVDMARLFAHRISFVHLRNVRRAEGGDFYEDNHLDGDIDLYLVMKSLLLEQQRRIQEGRPDSRMPMRPDHGHLMLPDRGRDSFYPGYSLYGRMRALAELRGLEVGIRRSLDL